MSYDLYFVRENAPSDEEFFEHFRGRDHYAINERQAWYFNEDTGVYFGFELPPDDDQLEEGGEDEDEDEADPDSWASFNINYFRPSFFREEAAIELEAFVERFGGGVSDPQIEGMGEGGAFTRAGFFQGWDAGNDFAVRSILKDHPEAFQHSRPSGELSGIWKWNFRRDELYPDDDIFDPRISLVQHDGRVLTVTIWGDGIPVALPRTDAVLVARQELRPFRLFGKDELETCLVHFHELEDLLEPFPNHDEHLPHRLLSYDEPPAELVRFIRKRKRTKDLQMLDPASILDAELVGMN
jgi:hypothetical protein